MTLVVSLQAQDCSNYPVSRRYPGAASDFTPARYYQRIARPRELPVLAGDSGVVADRIEEWFHGGACDGFVIAATHMPGAYEDFVQLVVPELQRRGVFHTEYAGPTLRENLGLPRAARGDRRVAGAGA